jgi:predicted permease
MRRLVSRTLGGVRALLHRRRVEEDLDDELRTYLDAAVARHLQKGISREDAIRAARVEMGSAEAVKDHVRDAGWESHLESLWRDAGYAVRMLRRAPTFTLVAVLSLALGIGASTAIFTLLNAILLRPLPVERPEGLVEVAARRSLISFAMYRDFRDSQQVFTDMAVTAQYASSRLTIPGASQPVQVDNVQLRKATGNYFALLGIQPVAGRFFTPGDDRGPNSHETAGSVIVLSYAFWQRQFGGNLQVIGQTILVNRSPCRVIGVAPRSFTGERVGSVPDGWIPLVPFTPANELEGRGGTFGSRFARLKPGVSREQAETAMTALFQRLLTAEGLIKDDVTSRSIVLASASAGVRSFVRVTYLMPLRIVMAVAILVLLIACANIANLLIARGARRQGEIGVRLAIGCGRARLMRQLLTESLVLSTLGAVAGVGVAYWGTTVLLQMVSPAEDPIRLDLAPDTRVLLFLIGMTFVTGIGFGVAPAWRASRVDAAAPLSVLGRRGGAAAKQRFSQALVVVQVAVSLLLLVGAGLLISSLRNLYATDRGFEPEHVVIFDLQHNPPQTEPTALARVADDIRTRVTGLAGIDSASVSWILLFSGRDQRARLEIPGYTRPSEERGRGAFIGDDGAIRARFNPVSPGYFETVGMTLMQGRRLDTRDGASAPRVAVVNEAMARAYFGPGSPLGRTFSIPVPRNLIKSDPIEIVGVVRDAKFNNLREDMRPMFYVPLAQQLGPLRSLEVRTRQPLAPLVASIRQALADVAPDVMVRRVISLSDQVDQSLSAERLLMRLSGFFGAVALLLACIGLYGVLAYSVAQRTAEIGVRLALGATRRAIIRLVLGDTAAMVLTGVVLGVLLALGATRLLASFLYGVTPTDAATFVSAIALLLGTAAAAAYVPSWRATRINPTVALRE